MSMAECERTPVPGLTTTFLKSAVVGALVAARQA
jgi:hypothetical protein